MHGPGLHASDLAHGSCIVLIGLAQETSVETPGAVLASIPGTGAP